MRVHALPVYACVCRVCARALIVVVLLARERLHSFPRQTEGGYV